MISRKETYIRKCVMKMRSRHNKTKEDIKKGLFNMGTILMPDKLYMTKLLVNNKDKRIDSFKNGNKTKLNCTNK
jgi:hypothetical protein